MGKRRKERQAREDAERQRFHEHCEALRASVGAKFGDGLELYKKMREGGPAQRELAKIYATMPADQADALISLYASNPLLKILMAGTSPGISPFTKPVALASEATEKILAFPGTKTPRK